MNDEDVQCTLTVRTLALLLKQAAEMGIASGANGTNGDWTAAGIAGEVLSRSGVVR